MAGNDMIELSVEIKAQSEKGLQVYDGKKLFWLPKSQTVCETHEWHQLKTGDTIDISIPEWLAEKHDLF